MAGAGGAMGTGGGCPSAPGTPLVLASGQNRPGAIASDGDSVYWINHGNLHDGSVQKCSVCGCDAPFTFADNQPMPFALAIDADHIYWANNNDDSIYRCAKTGCGAQPDVVVKGPYVVGGIAVDAERIYFSAENSGQVYTCPIAGCSGAPDLLASNQPGPTLLALDGLEAYWLVGGGVNSCEVFGCSDSPNPIAQGGPPSLEGLAVRGGWVFWSELQTGQVRRCPTSGCADGSLTLAAGEHWPSRLATDGVDVYWAATGDSTGGGSVKRCAVGGCAGVPTVLASDPGAPQGLALDAHAVYWTDVLDGHIMKLAR
jgi:hypothetical protein